MTRRKWTKLRRQRPELFKPIGSNLAWWAWESLSRKDLNIVRRLSKGEVLAGLTAHKLRGE